MGHWDWRPWPQKLTSGRRKVSTETAEMLTRLDHQVFSTVALVLVQVQRMKRNRPIAGCLTKSCSFQWLTQKNAAKGGLRVLNNKKMGRFGATGLVQDLERQAPCLPGLADDLEPAQWLPCSLPLGAKRSSHGRPKPFNSVQNCWSDITKIWVWFWHLFLRTSKFLSSKQQSPPDFQPCQLLHTDPAISWPHDLGWKIDTDSTARSTHLSSGSTKQTQSNLAPFKTHFAKEVKDCLPRATRTQSHRYEGYGHSGAANALKFLMLCFWILSLGSAPALVLKDKTCRLVDL